MYFQISALTVKQRICATKNSTLIFINLDPGLLKGFWRFSRIYYHAVLPMILLEKGAHCGIKSHKITLQ